MILEQHYLDCLAQASYLIVDEKTKRAIVVDPRRDVDLYVERAAELGAKIDTVLLTHFHADFLSGHLELRERCGATIRIGARGEASFEFMPLEDGEKIEFGDVLIECLSTPGHTPESMSFVVYDLAEDRENPHAVLTGDTLFIGDVGRPDLLGSVGITPETLAGWMYDSLRTKLMPLPDDTIVYPGHGAGSACGKNLSTDTFSTMGKQREFNYALQDMERDAFIELLTSNQPDPPAYFPYDVKMNREEHATLSTVLERNLRALDWAEAARLQASGAQVVDVRDSATFALGHYPGSIHIGLNGKFASWVGTLLDPEQDFVIVAAPGDEEQAVKRLGRIGFDRVAGFVSGGIESAAPGTLVTRERIDVAELAKRIESDAAPFLVDVRTPTEYEAGHIEGALPAPLARLAERIADIPRDREVVLLCKTGYRSSTAATLLDRAGIHGALDLVGGMDAWNGVPEDAPPTCGA